MNLVIDIGNTAIKSGFFQDDKLIEKQYHHSIEDVKQLINNRKPANILASSTGQELFRDTDWPEINIIRMSPGLSLPFKSEYATPETLGADRIAAVAGASKLFPGENVLAIDLGTCITYDFIAMQNIYKGGAISPGINMRFKAMKHFTARLPELPVPDRMPDVTGDSTRSCMESGVLNGVSFEIEGMVAAYKKFGEIKTILTGGDAFIFEKKFKEYIFAAPDLVLIGLNVILQHNVEIS